MNAPLMETDEVAKCALVSPLRPLEEGALVGLFFCLGLGFGHSPP